jgi:hypothetical protein
MKHLTLLLFAAVVLTGCAHEAYYTDNEYGVASMDAYDRMIVHKDYAHADKTVDGMEGIHAESTMQLYHDSFSEGFTQDTYDINTNSSSNRDTASD